MTVSERYSTVAIVLHWTIATLIVLVFALGLTVDVFPTDWEHAVVNTHVLLGLLILVLSLARLAWRLAHRPPAPAEGAGRLAQRAAELVHYALYALMILVPLIGIPTLLYRGVGLDLGVLEIASPFARDRAVAGPLTEVHELAAYALIALAAGHALAALYHHFVRHDDVLRRMMPAHGG
ncbi:cytochrome b [Propylenella binzhouense]|uniref:Cytochrome b n=1 Tax=Propylenella binzhouense TaxID=2555902 RepID=A0A964WTQ6_9HYPH|nr:cytochrome b/b6 domain-containing protein [Propylenella binzhouense]MYZ48231.1 cytochrome b [Propylenella binzhouense]